MAIWDDLGPGSLSHCPKIVPSGRLLKALAKGQQGEGIPYSRELMQEIAEAARKDMGSKRPWQHGAR